MVKIRYSELPAGLHVAARRRGRSTVILLLPGLTPAERRTALARIRSSARIGKAHQISALALLCARGTDRTKMVAAATLAAIRKHPVVLLPPLIGAAGTILTLTLAAPIALPTTPSQLPEAGQAGTAQPSTQSGSALAATPPALHVIADRLPLRNLWRPGPGPGRSSVGPAAAGRAWSGHDRFTRVGAGRGWHGPGMVEPALPTVPVHPGTGESAEPRQPVASGGAIAPDRPSPAAGPSTGTSLSAVAEPSGPGSRPRRQRAAPRPTAATSVACAISVPVLGGCLLG
ncbi:MAG TPA: hypothetical protein VGI58_16655 [Streptosporangiaceae bacterium]